MENIDNILEKYFEGETSLQEEQTLRNYFRQSDIDIRHKVYAPMFDYFTEERKNEGFEKKKKKSLLYIWGSRAATILLIVSTGLFYSKYEMTKSTMYIDGKKITNIKEINSEALISIQNISEIDQEIIDSQINILESFLE